MVNSGIRKIGMITRTNYSSLMDHVGSGKEWDLSRKRDGLYILPPFSASENFSYTANYHGRMEALANSLNFTPAIRIMNTFFCPMRIWYAM